MAHRVHFSEISKLSAFFNRYKTVNLSTKSIQEESAGDDTVENDFAKEKEVNGDSINEI